MKKYTKKQIQEAIKHWKSELRKLNEEQNPWQNVDVEEIVKKAQKPNNGWTKVSGKTIDDVKAIFNIPSAEPRNKNDRMTAEHQSYFLVLWNDDNISGAYQERGGRINGCGCGEGMKGLGPFARQYNLDLDHAIIIYQDGKVAADVKPVKITPEYKEIMINTITYA